MSLNKSKGQLIRFLSKKSSNPFQYMLKNDIIKEVQAYKYVGVILSSDITWINHTNSISSETSKTLCASGIAWVLFLQNLKKLSYEIFVWPKLRCASAIWSPTKTMLEAVQNTATRYIYYWITTTQKAPPPWKKSLNFIALETRRKVARRHLVHKLCHSYHG